jgi:hypothetical protein
MYTSLNICKDYHNIQVKKENGQAASFVRNILHIACVQCVYRYRHRVRAFICPTKLFPGFQTSSRHNNPDEFN